MTAADGVRRPPARSPPAAVVLAAGEGRRFAPFGPKWNAPIGPESAVRRLVRLTRAAGCDPVVVVGGAQIDELRRELRSTDATCVENRDWRSGRTGSVQTGLRAVGPADIAVVWPVDVPFVAASTLPTLLRAAEPGGIAIWWTPVYERRGGHPILLERTAQREVLELPTDSALRAAPFRGGPSEARVPVPDPGVLDNVNSPAEFLEAAERWRARGSL